MDVEDSTLILTKDGQYSSKITPIGGSSAGLLIPKKLFEKLPWKMGEKIVFKEDSQKEELRICLLEST